MILQTKKADVHQPFCYFNPHLNFQAVVSG